MPDARYRIRRRCRVRAGGKFPRIEFQMRQNKYFTRYNLISLLGPRLHVRNSKIRSGFFIVLRLDYWEYSCVLWLRTKNAPRPSVNSHCVVRYLAQSVCTVQVTSIQQLTGTVRTCTVFSCQKVWKRQAEWTWLTGWRYWRRVTDNKTLWLMKAKWLNKTESLTRAKWLTKANRPMYSHS
jgi:hypothetical protein